METLWGSFLDAEFETAMSMVCFVPRAYSGFFDALGMIERERWIEMSLKEGKRQREGPAKQFLCLKLTILKIVTLEGLEKSRSCAMTVIAQVGIHGSNVLIWKLHLSMTQQECT